MLHKNIFFLNLIIDSTTFSKKKFCSKNYISFIAEKFFYRIQAGKLSKFYVLSVNR